MSDYEEMLAVFKAGFRARFDAPGMLRPEGDEAIRAGIRAVVDALVKEARGWKAGNSDDSQRMVWLMNKQADALEGSEGLTVHYLNRAEAAESERDRLKGRLALAVAMLRPHYEDDYLQSKFSKALGGDAS